jgi:hypothetical protein
VHIVEYVFLPCRLSNTEFLALATLLLQGFLPLAQTRFCASLIFSGFNHGFHDGSIPKICLCRRSFSSLSIGGKGGGPDTNFAFFRSLHCYPSKSLILAKIFHLFVKQPFV